MDQYHWVPFWPRTAALNAVVVNNLYIAELGLCGLILLMVIGMTGTFCLRHRQGSTVSRADLIKKTWPWEIGWTTATLLAFLVLFCWGASIYIWLLKTPPGDIEVFVVAKKWMWKFQIQVASVKSTPCMFRSIRPSAWSWFRKTLYTAFLCLLSGSSTMWFPAPMRQFGSRRLKPAPTKSNAHNIAAFSTRR